MKRKSKSFNVVICPPGEISKKAIKVSGQFKKKGGLFVLNERNYFPHLTIYLTEFPLENVPKIKKLLQQVASETKPFPIKSLRYRQSRGGYIDVAFHKSANLKKLQERIIRLLNPLREGLIMEMDKDTLSNSSKAEQKNIKLYGYRYAGSEFDPHLTFTKLEKFDRLALSGIKKQNFSFTVNRLGFFYLGDYGICRKLIEFFDLS